MEYLAKSALKISALFHFMILLRNKAFKPFFQ